jgi:hypothetical protein
MANSIMAKRCWAIESATPLHRLHSVNHHVAVELPQRAPDAGKNRFRIHSITHPYENVTALADHGHHPVQKLLKRLIVFGFHVVGFVRRQAELFDVPHDANNLVGALAIGALRREVDMLADGILSRKIPLREGFVDTITRAECSLSASVKKRPGAAAGASVSDSPD